MEPVRSAKAPLLPKRWYFPPGSKFSRLIFCLMNGSPANSAARAGCPKAAAVTAQEVCQSAQRFHGLFSFTAADDFVADIKVLGIALFEVGTVLGGCVAVGGDVGEIDHQAV